jgi:hypothetical protein
MNPIRHHKKLVALRDELKLLGRRWDSLHAAIVADGRCPVTQATAEETATARHIACREQEIRLAGARLEVEA